MSRMTKYSKNSSRSRRTPKSDKSAMADAELVKTQKEAAKYSGVSERTIRRWVKAGMPRTENNRYIRKMLDFFAENEGSQPTKAKTRKEEASANKTEHQAEQLKRELEIEKGKLVYIDEYLNNEVKRHLAVNRSLGALPRIVAARVPEKIRRKVQAIVKEEVDKMRDAFAEGRPVKKAKL